MGVYGPQFQPNTNRVGKDSRLPLPKAPGVPKPPKLKPFGGAPAAGTVKMGMQQTGPTPGAQPGVQPGGQPGGGAGNLDSTYFANTNANQFKVNNQVNALGLQGQQAGTSLQAALAQLAYQQPRAQLGLEQKANQMGALYSTPYDQSAGDLNYQFLGRQGGAVNKFAGTMDSLASKIQGLQGGVPLYDAEQAAASTGRLSNLAAKNPALGGSPPVTAQPSQARNRTTAPRSNRLARAIAAKSFL